MKIYLSPVNLPDGLIRSISGKLSANFSVEISTLYLNFDLESIYFPERKQYYSTAFLKQAVEKTEAFDGKVVILTNLDLFVPVLTFVFGEAQLNGKHSVVSLCRLYEEFYSNKGNDNLFLNRAAKEILHELGHNFGLLHCIDWDCVMHSSNSIEEVDIKGDFYCRNCQSTLSNLNILK
ncbi:MAG TPA: archaemetzincin family Zn-dependent metalloprotease [Ignavibacteria bacterium]|nr:archaemetzincin family Zn-dependent metalloprotease [Ignavibacteria bacterium]